MKPVNLITTFFLIILIFSCKTPNEKSVKITFPKYLITNEFVSSENFQFLEINKLIEDRIEQGIYDGYNVELCVDNPERCDSTDFGAHPDLKGLKIRIYSEKWDEYNQTLKDEILNEILFYTWGHQQNKFNPLVFQDSNQQSPFDFLNNLSAKMFMNFSPTDYLKGGKGGNAYGPNCWYNSISSIVDQSRPYAISKELQSSSWSNPRFMGPSEFRCFMKKFEQVSDPIFGDIVRYYTDSIHYDESRLIYNGEVHAANYVGTDTINKIEEVILTKNGRSDLGFLIFQDSKEADSYYLSDKNNDPRIKGFFRVRPKSTFYDPAICGKCSDCYEAYKVDSINYFNRWKCLDSKLKTCNDSTSCYECFPGKSNWQLFSN